MHYHSEKLSSKAEWVEGHVHAHRASGKGRLAHSGVCPVLRAPFLAVHLWPVGKLRWAHLSLSDTEGELLIASECCSLRSSLFCCSVVSDSLWPHGLQHARLPCPSPSPRVCSDSCPLSQWCHPTISSSVIPFSSWLQSFPASGSFPMSQFFTSGGQNVGASASASPSNEYSWLISFRSEVIDTLGLSIVFLFIFTHSIYFAINIKI